jgi:hypothetical protein
MVSLFPGVLARVTAADDTGGKARMHSGRLALTPVVLLLLLGASAALAGVTVQAEAEQFIDSYNIGGLELSKEFCSAASEYYAVDGLDVVGEWIEMEIAVPTTGNYQPRLGYQVEYEDSSAVRVTVLDDVAGRVNRVSDFELLEGWGFG